MTTLLAEPSAVPTTSGILAMRNLQAEIDGLRLHALHGSPGVADRTALIEALSLRGHVLGSVTDNERAAELAEQFVRDDVESGQAFLSRARTRSAFHRFSDAWSDLDTAQQLGIDTASIDDERAAIHQAVGRYDEALAIRREAAERQPGFRSLAALAGILAERREVDEAERMFLESQMRYRGVSPFPLAILDLQHGHLRLVEGDVSRARAKFDASRRRLPGYAPAQGHLAEVDAALGDPAAAIQRLRPLAASSENPEYAAQLARILGDLGRPEESGCLRAQAARRYDELVARHVEAFAGHAAEFWLEVGGDPARAMELARLNLEVRQTPRARTLLARAERAYEGRHVEQSGNPAQALLGGA